MIRQQDQTKVLPSRLEAGVAPGPLLRDIRAAFSDPIRVTYALAVCAVLGFLCGIMIGVWPALGELAGKFPS